MREDVISAALQMSPPPAVPDDARKLIDQGEAALKVASTAGEYRKAAVELNRALKLAPWYAPGYTALADAEEGANDLDAAASSLRAYLIAAPTAADSASVSARISELEQQAVQQRQQAAEQRKLAELKKQQEQKQAEIDKERQEEKQPRNEEQTQDKYKAAAEADCRREHAAVNAYLSCLQRWPHDLDRCTDAPPLFHDCEYLYEKYGERL